MRETNVVILIVLKMNFDKVKQYATKNIILYCFLFVFAYVFVAFKILTLVKSIK